MSIDPSLSVEKPSDDPASVQSQQVQIQVDESKTDAAYANFCRVTGTPEELIVDFGLNSQVGNMPTSPIVISDRVVMSFYTAKRLLYALNATIERHEKVFGQVELDFQKRAKQ